MKPTKSPWGKIDFISQFGTAPETWIVSTSSHGGVMMPKMAATALGILEYAEQISSEGKKWACFEEDCKISVAVLALALKGQFELTDERLRNCLMSLCSWNPSYLASIDLNNGTFGDRIKDIQKANSTDFDRIAENRKNREKDRQMRDEKNPNLIVSAIRIDNISEIKKYLNFISKINNLAELDEIQDIYAAMEKELDFFQGNPEAILSKGKLTLVWTAADRRYLVRNYEIREPNLLSYCDKVAEFIN